MKKIKKINIENVGSFLIFQWDNSLTKNKNGIESIIELEKNNIFYGDNGNGKSTLTKIFKKLNGSNLELSKNWESGNESKPQKIEVINQDGDCFDLSSQEYNDKFLVFDKQFIQDNIGDIVFGGDSSSNNKARGNKIIILGGFIEKEKILEKFVSIISDLENKNKLLLENITSGGNLINSHLLEDKKISAYKTNISSIESQSFDFYNKKIKEIELNIKNLNTTLENSEKIKKLQKLEFIDEIKFKQKKFEKTFAEIFNSVDFNYQEGELVQQLLEKTTENDLNKCLFCEQEIKERGSYISKIQKLIEHFSVKEKEISDNLEELKIIINYIKQDSKEFEILNKKNQLKFQQFLSCIGSTELKYSDFEINIDNKLDLYLIKIGENIKQKNNIKSKKIELDLSQLNILIDDINVSIKSFQSDITEINTRIDNIGKTTINETTTKIKDLTKELNELQNKLFIKNNYSKIENFLIEYERYEENRKNIKVISDSKDTFRREVSESFKTFAEKYGKSIGKVLKELNSSLDINFDFKNGNRAVGYERGSSKYGFEIHYNNQNRTESLSEGEKRSIALSYFFAEIFEKIEKKKELESQKNIASGKETGEISNKLESMSHFFDKILVLDDPAVDFDIGHKKVIANFIANVSKEFKQTFILSHDSLFVKYLSNSYATGKKFWIYKTKGVSNITEFNGDIFKKYLEDLEYFSENKPTEIQDLYIITYKLRFCIEKMIKDDLLGFGNNSIDGLIKQHIGNIDKIKIISPQASNLATIYNYCNNNGSHYGETEGYNSTKKMIDEYLKIYSLI